MTGTGPGRIRIEPVKREWADALSNSDAEFTRRFAVPVEASWAGFPEALPIIIAAAVLARCGFARVAELIDPDEGPVWRWELRLDGNTGQRV